MLLYYPGRYWLSIFYDVILRKKLWLWLWIRHLGFRNGMYWLVMPFLAKMNQWKSTNFVYVLCWSFNICTCYELNQWKSFAFEDWKSLVYVLCTWSFKMNQGKSFTFVLITVKQLQFAILLMLPIYTNKNNKQNRWVAKNTLFHLHFCSSLSGSYINKMSSSSYGTWIKIKIC